jgi:Carboxypeptidase regulatory-like domain
MRWALLVVVGCASARGQCLIGGMVRDAESGKPLARVRVFAKPPAPPPAAPAGSEKPAILRISDAAGAFCFDSLEAGTYQLVAQHAGYLTAVHGAKPGQTDGTPFNTDGRTAQPPVIVRMVAGARISGTVVDERGQPVENTLVQLQTKKWDWVWEPSHVAGTTTGPGGAFRFPPVPGGTYYLSASPLEVDRRMLIRIPEELGAHDIGPLMDEKGRLIIEGGGAATFYRGSYSFAHAAPIPVRAGQDVANVALSLLPRVSRHVSGRVSGSFDPKALAAAEVMLTPAIEMPPPEGLPHTARIAPDGTFLVDHLGVLEYDVTVNGLRASITARVDLANSDAEGLVLTPARSFDLQVRARIEGQDAAPTQPMAMCDLVHGCQQRNPPDDKGVYHFSAVPQAIYRFHSRGPGVYVKSVIVDGKPLSDAQLDLRRSAPESIEVVLSPNLASLEGGLEHADSPAGLTINVMLVDEIRYSPAVSNIFVAADSAGRFHFDALIPGKYHVLAIEGFDDGPWGSPELFAALAAKSVAVELGEGQKKTVTLPVTSVSEWEAALRRVGM